jgi:hypothetical protein
MAKLGMTIRPTDHDTTQRDYAENVPDGVYRMEMDASDTNVGDKGIGLKTTFNILEPEEYKGRKIFGYYNLEHTSADAQRIGRAQFSALCRAIGESDDVEDSEVLHMRSFVATVGLGKDSKEKNSDGSPKYAAKSEIKRYWFEDEGNVPTPAISDKQPAVPAAANNNQRPANNDSKPAAAASKPAGARPWAKKAA